MPRYQFNIVHGDPDTNATILMDLPDGGAAWAEATKTCGEMIRDIDGKLATGTDWHMQVSDEAGPLFKIRFGAENCRSSPRHD